MVKINKNTNFEISEDFLEVCQLIYPDQIYLQDNPLELSMLFSEINPFFDNGEASIHLLKNKTRAIVFTGPDISHKSNPAAYFGFFESIDSKQDAIKLFEEIEKQLTEQNINTLIGPINFNTYHRYRLNLDEENPTPFLNEPQNPKYYPTLLAASGFSKLNKYVSYIINSQEKLKNWYDTYSSKKDILTFEGYTFEQITPSLWMEKLAEVHKKSEIVFGDNFSYSPISFETFQLKYGEFFSHLICPHTSLFAYYNGEIVGTIINFPNYYDLIRKGFGITDLNFKNYIDNAEEATLLLKTVGMVKEHANMGFLLLRMMLEITPNAFEHYEKYVCCLMAEDNYPAMLAKEFSDHTKEYALYIKEF